MNHIVKKAIVSMVSGAACTFGSWIVKHMLDKGDEQFNKRFVKTERKGSA